jgi:death-on-curing protein
VTDEPLWMDRDELHLLYGRQVELFGGSFGVRDENLPQSALHRPRMRFNYAEDADLFDLAAAYLVGLVKNHAYVDGNRRIGLAAALSFLGANGWRVTGPADELLVLVLSVATSQTDESAAAAWFRAHAEPRR